MIYCGEPKREQPKAESAINPSVQIQQDCEQVYVGPTSFLPNYPHQLYRCAKRATRDLMLVTAWQDVNTNGNPLS